MGGVLVDDYYAIAGLGDDVGFVQLRTGGAERVIVRRFDRAFFFF